MINFNKIKQLKEATKRCCLRIADRQSSLIMKKGNHMLKSKVLAVVIISAFAGSVLAQAPATKPAAPAEKAGKAADVKDQAVVISGKNNLLHPTGSTITAANGTIWNVDKTVITIDGKAVTKTELNNPAIKNCVLTGTRAGTGVNTVTTLACKSV